MREFSRNVYKTPKSEDQNFATSFTLVLWRGDSSIHWAIWDVSSVSPINPYPAIRSLYKDGILAVKAVIATERKNGSLKNLVDAEILFNIVQTDP